MPLSDMARDRLKSLCIVSRGLSELCEAASEHANSDDVRTDPTMKSVRRQYLTAVEMGAEFLKVDRPYTGPARKTGVEVMAYITSENVEDDTVMTAANVASANQTFNAGKTYTLVQVQAWMFGQDVNGGGLLVTAEQFFAA